MPKGASGRIVVEIEPELKKELYTALDREGIRLKQWFLSNVENYLKESNSQISLEFATEDGDSKGSQMS